MYPSGTMGIFTLPARSSSYFCATRLTASIPRASLASQSSPGLASAASIAASPPDPSAPHLLGKQPPLTTCPLARPAEDTPRSNCSNVLRANHCWLSPKYSQLSLGSSQPCTVPTEAGTQPHGSQPPSPGPPWPLFRRSFCLCSISFGIVYRDCPSAILRPHIVFPI